MGRFWIAWTKASRLERECERLRVDVMALQTQLADANAYAAFLAAELAVAETRAANLTALVFGARVAGPAVEDDGPPPVILPFVRPSAAG